MYSHPRGHTVHLLYTLILPDTVELLEDEEAGVLRLPVGFSTDEVKRYKHCVPDVQSSTRSYSTFIVHTLILPDTVELLENEEAGVLRLPVAQMGSSGTIIVY